MLSEDARPALILIIITTTTTTATTTPNLGGITSVLKHGSRRACLRDASRPITKQRGAAADGDAHVRCGLGGGSADARARASALREGRGLVKPQRLRAQQPGVFESGRARWGRCPCTDSQPPQERDALLHATTHEAAAEEGVGRTDIRSVVVTPASGAKLGLHLAE